MDKIECMTMSWHVNELPWSKMERQWYLWFRLFPPRSSLSLFLQRWTLKWVCVFERLTEVTLSWTSVSPSLSVTCMMLKWKCNKSFINIGFNKVISNASDIVPQCVLHGELFRHDKFKMIKLDRLLHTKHSASREVKNILVHRGDFQEKCFNSTVWQWAEVMRNWTLHCIDYSQQIWLLL